MLDGELQGTGLGVQVADHGDFAEESGDRHPLAPLDVGGHPDVGQGVVDKVAQAHEAAAEDGSGTAVDGDGSLFQRVEREERGVEDVANFVSQLSGSLDFFASIAIRR